eukprot:CAMPEP_0175611468 /NCGR_PEP_ID=MMETSP0096-20121207/63318_1 /TAXON_ID=311494 /ORGANISM="Alexandrium monilatum, Strain CCMP3105" /LENGTH=374 /DNA_ID=CAMNT_0016916473 /DNA_START=11 /DNA_END=1135 /DNA_ORIENTATION=+
MGCTAATAAMQREPAEALPVLLGDLHCQRCAAGGLAEPCKLPPAGALRALDAGAPGAGAPGAGGARGFGDLVTGVHHVALVVADVGCSLSFYTDVVGFEQIDRVNFDRHGAWLSMGNVQLHLIKGVPHTRRGQHPHDLIVSHISLDVSDIGAVAARLRRLQAELFTNLRWRQNISVPSHESSGADRFESDHTSAEGKLTQFFLEDPDGYWLEFCNCGEDEERAASATSRRGEGRELHGGRASRLRLGHVAQLSVRTLRWVRRARARLACGESLDEELARLAPVSPERVDARTLSYFCRRRNTYGDICQGFSDEKLRDALAAAGNHAPGAVLLLKRHRREAGQVYQPPNFLDDKGRIWFAHAFVMHVSNHASRWV